MEGNVFTGVCLSTIGLMATRFTARPCYGAVGTLFYWNAFLLGFLFEEGGEDRNPIWSKPENHFAHIPMEWEGKMKSILKLVKILIFRSRLLGNFPPVTWLLIINMFLCTEIEGKTLLFALAEWGYFQEQMNFNLTQKQWKWKSAKWKLPEKILTLLNLPKQVHPLTKCGDFMHLHCLHSSANLPHTETGAGEWCDYFEEIE